MTLPKEKFPMLENPINLDILVNEPMNAYHAQAVDFMSSHQLGAYTQSPLLYHRRKLGLAKFKPSKSFELGTATHTKFLEGENEFDAENISAEFGPTNPTTGRPYGADTKKVSEWQREHGKKVWSFEDMDLIQTLTNSLRLHPICGEIVGDGNGLAEGVLRADYHGWECQIRIDWLHPRLGIFDLKTCRDLKLFEKDCEDYSYFNQLAFYQKVLAEKIGVDVPVYIMAVEKCEPYAAACYRIAQYKLNEAAVQNERALDELKVSTSDDTWPSGYEELRTLS